jgi:acyl-CoA synthetase (AMP-forming)/AMP-acid ligase II
MKGYYNKPDHTARVIDSQGWYHTGDLGKLDEDGFLYVSGRVDDMIIVAGKNIHPEDIEQVLLQHPEMQEAAVIGRPDEMRGQTIVAFVLPKPGAMPRAADLRAFCIPRLANHQIPKEFLLVRDLPRNTMGKVQRFRLVGEFRDYLLET